MLNYLLTTTLIRTNLIVLVLIIIQFIIGIFSLFIYFRHLKEIREFAYERLIIKGILNIDNDDVKEEMLSILKENDYRKELEMESKKNKGKEIKNEKNLKKD
jgi:hypothetical protein